MAALLAIPATAAAGPGGAPTVHDHRTFTDGDANFCGTARRSTSPAGSTSRPSTTSRFDAADNVVGVDVISVHGPHPAFESDIWCEEATTALGSD